MSKSSTEVPLTDAVKTYVNQIDNALMSLGTHLPGCSQRVFLERERKRLVIEGDNLIDQMEKLEVQMTRLQELLERVGLKT
jgi:hypothetical protein